MNQLIIVVNVVVAGVGWSLTTKLNNMDIYTCGDLQTMSLSSLQKQFGPKIGQSLYKYCRGQDYRPIKLDLERKSVSAEVNYGIRFTKVTCTSRNVGKSESTSPPPVVSPIYNFEVI